MLKVDNSADSGSESCVNLMAHPGLHVQKQLNKRSTMEWWRFIWVLQHAAAVGRRVGGGAHPQGSPVLGSRPRCKPRNPALCSTLPEEWPGPPAQPDQYHRSTTQVLCELCEILHWAAWCSFCTAEAEQKCGGCGEGCILVSPSFPASYVSSQWEYLAMFSEVE